MTVLVLDTMKASTRASEKQADEVTQLVASVGTNTAAQASQLEQVSVAVQLRVEDSVMKDNESVTRSLYQANL
jgi:hypothetical protein